MAMNKKVISNYTMMFIIGFTILFSSTDNSFKALSNDLEIDTGTTAFL